MLSKIEDELGIRVFENSSLAVKSLQTLQR